MSVSEAERSAHEKSLVVFIVGCLFMVLISGVALAIPTQVTVTVKSKDAKFIGTSMGGALVIVKNFRTGEVLAKGYTKGSTGDTNKIMMSPQTRGTVLSDENSAKYTASLDLEEPTYVEISAYGPMAQRQSINRATITQWLLPGKDITAGDGIMLIIPGFTVDILSPRAHVGFAGVPQTVAIEANITMACGCPIQPGGLWDADTFEIQAIMQKDGKDAGKIKMRYAGEASLFTGTYTASEPGSYEITVYAFDKSNGNTGLDQTTFIVR